ncbi:MAG: Sugar kinase, ribokinase family [Bryobacterales bacterium]|jgi:ribokinase|nr:Sugar kinase, ribokinase family [Bryobacterales bacterium]
MGRVVVCGNVVFDILARPVEEVRWGATTVIEQVEQQLGGNGGTTSCTIATLGVPVSLITLAGRDASAETVFARLSAAGVILDAVQYVDAATSIAISLVRSDGERALLYLLGAASQEFQPFHLPADATHFHLAAVYRMQHLRTIAPRLLREAKEAGLRTSLDTQWDTQGEWRTVLEPSLPFTDYTLVNEDEARMLTGHTDPELAAGSLRDSGATNVIIKLGPKGCWANGTYLPSYPVEAVDTTGAGDCFSGGFVAALERGLSLTDAAMFANAVGALAVQKVGATAGVRAWDQTVAWAANQTTDERASTP